MRRKIFLMAALAVFALALLACNQQQPQQPASTTPPPPPPKATTATAKTYALPDVVDCSAECAHAASANDDGVYDMDLGETGTHDAICLTPNDGKSIVFKKHGKKIKVKKFTNNIHEEVESPFHFTPPYPTKHLKKIGSGPIRAVAIPAGSVDSTVCYKYKTVGETDDNPPVQLDPHIFTHGGTGLSDSTTGGGPVPKKP